MKHFTTLLFVALLTFAVVFMAMRPEILSEIWLWLIGLSGAIIATVKKIFHAEKADEHGAHSSAKPRDALRSILTDDFQGITLSVLRYADDQTTTLGLMYLEHNFFSYTLEDSHHDIKKPGETRIPAGTYRVDFRREDTQLTLKYRQAYPNWFSYHLEVKNVPGFQGIYIHNGGDHHDTKGCLLVSDQLNAGEHKTLTNSRNTFKRLYQYLENKLNKGMAVRLVVHDESWFLTLNA